MFNIFKIHGRVGALATLGLALMTAPTAAQTVGSIAVPNGPLVGFVDQGPNWTPNVDAKRRAFYAQDQGSQIMPLAWMQALRQPDGQSFLADGLARYGYLPNPYSGVGLPVGFTSAGSPGGEFVGMTCAACHTRQIQVSNVAYRIDGGPAFADFQSFLTDLDTAVGAVLKDETAFKAFANSVLGETAGDPDAMQTLHDLLEDWYERYHTLMSRALPKIPWGPGRLDAVGMIFNRLTGLDIGPPGSPVIAENIRVADAPTRYPFLWNAPIQDKTQWPGFADNGDDVLALSRNLGEVFGVFAAFQPKKEWWHLLGYNYLSDNSANFDGLRKLENLVKDIGPPKWPWPLDVGLIRQGKAIFARTDPKVNCKGCHWIRPGTPRFFNDQTWKTPVQDVGTDSREHAVMGWTVKTGVLAGAQIPFIQEQPLKPEGELAFNVLANAVLGSILQSYVPPLLMSVELPSGGGAPDFVRQRLQQRVQGLAQQPKLRQLRGAFPTLQKDDDPCRKPGAFCYESRVLEGIWAAAPYLHNGSVPSLTELLKKPSERKARFKIGPNYDIVDIGLAEEQPTTQQAVTTTDCSARESGNSRCGHDFGTELTSEEKRALLEYLKTL